MREIKFRAWNDKAKKMYTPDGTGDLDRDEWYADRWQIFNGALDSVQRKYVLMQYTGLNDKSGREIYEGDIVKGYFSDAGDVRFGRYSAGGLDYYASAAYGFYVQRSTQEDDTETLTSSCEIIGNIYENSELLLATQPERTQPLNAKGETS